MTAILFEGVFLLVFIVLTILAGKRLRAAQVRRIDVNRRSPKSRPIRLE